ncbi:RNase adapter RapZ [Streptomyces niveus]|uniref:RapZ C-terminal domain-containing protein n=1 Tax=Streptomyces niveus TaxID=193462 RepID=UPI00386835D2|nr:RNase adapter RapZ [Streptomyces niveus]
MTSDQNLVRVTIRTIGTLHPGAMELIEDGLYFDLGNKLRNPHHDPAMRYRTGLDEEVADHVLTTPGAMELSVRMAESARELAYGYANRNQKLVHVTIACRGGRHRSVAMAERVAEYLRIDDIGVEVEHRHIDRPVVEKQA